MPQISEGPLSSNWSNCEHFRGRRFCTDSVLYCEELMPWRLCIINVSRHGRDSVKEASLPVDVSVHYSPAVRRPLNHGVK